MKNEILKKEIDKAFANTTTEEFKQWITLRFNDVSKTEIHEAFMKMISEDMTTKEFEEWTLSWLSYSHIISIAKQWSTELKKEELEKFYNK